MKWIPYSIASRHVPVQRRSPTVRSRPAQTERRAEEFQCGLSLQCQWADGDAGRGLGSVSVG